MTADDPLQALHLEIDKCKETANAQKLLVSDSRMQLVAARKDAARNLQSRNKSQAIIKQAPLDCTLTELHCLELLGVLMKNIDKSDVGLAR